VSERAKQAAAERAVEYVEEGMTVGLGTGSTAAYAIRRIAERVRAGLNIKAVATSQRSTELAEALGMAVHDLSTVSEIDLTIDGADEVDADFCLIKGGGAALLREKIVATISRKVLTVVDSSKVKEVLGEFPLPVEVVRFGWPITKRQVEALGCTSTRREREGQAVVTDEGHYLLDCHFGPIAQPRDLAFTLNNIPGVVENGLFVDLTDHLIVGYEDGHVEERRKGEWKRGH